MTRSAPFARQVLRLVRRIPPGRVSTYGDVAAMAGRPRAARAVGHVMQRCHEIDVPCHRVVSAGGLLGGFGTSPALKRELLRAEGVTVSRGRIRGFSRLRWSNAARNGEP